MAVADELQEAHALEAAVAAHGLAEVAKDLQALERQPRLVLVGVVHAHESPRLACGARGQMAALEQHHVADTQEREVERRAGAVGAPADDDHVGRAGHDGRDSSICPFLQHS